MIEIILVDVDGPFLREYPFLIDLTTRKAYLSNAETYHASLIEGIQENYDPDFYKGNGRTPEGAARYEAIIRGTIRDEEDPVAGLQKYIDSLSALREATSNELQIEVIDPYPEYSEEDHDAGVWDKKRNLLGYMYGSHHLDLFMHLNKIEPELTEEYMAGYGLNNPNLVMGDIFDGRIRDYSKNPNAREPIIQQLQTLHRKESSQQIIKEGIEVPTQSNSHGYGTAFFLLDDGRLFQSTTSTGHYELYRAIDAENINEDEIWEDEVWDLYYRTVIHGRIKDKKYLLYEPKQPQIDQQAFKKEMEERGYQGVPNPRRLNFSSWEKQRLKIEYHKNDGHILRKPFYYDKQANILTIGKPGTGYLYDRYYTLLEPVPNEVRTELNRLAEVEPIKFEYIPSSNLEPAEVEPGFVENMLNDLIPGVYRKKTNTVYYSDKGSFHLNILDHLGINEQHGQDAISQNIGVGNYDFQTGILNIFGFNRFSKTQIKQIEQFFARFLEQHYAALNIFGKT